jgi:hypothetical protein
MSLPKDAKERKDVPLYSGLVKYFPDALIAVAALSKKGNDQHNPGEPLHWAREKSTDEPDALLRHLFEAGTIDVDGVRHSAKVAWRALALLQKEIEAAAALPSASVTCGTIGYTEACLDDLVSRLHATTDLDAVALVEVEAVVEKTREMWT